MSPCLGCLVFAKDEHGHDKTWPEEWNHACAGCDKEFVKGDRLIVVDDAVLYHYDCYDDPKPEFEKAVITLD